MRSAMISTATSLESITLLNLVYFTRMYHFFPFFFHRFRRRMSIPEGVNPESVTSTLSPGGVLTILAPKMCVEGKHQS